MSDNIFEKRRKSCFINKELLFHIKSLGADEIEFVGFDGNYCVASSAYNAVKLGFKAFINENCIGIRNSKRYIRTRKYLKESGVLIK